MNVLVTGGTGFLGKASCLALQEQGHVVSAIGRRAERGELLQQQGVGFHQADLLNPADYDSSFKNQDVVVHCAALSSVWGPYKTFHRANVESTQNVISLCRKHNVRRLVYISSPSIYVSSKDRESIGENDPLPRKSVNHYAATKRQAEQFADEAANEMEVFTLRPQALFGPEDPAIVPRLVRANLTRGIPYFNQGRTKIDVTYVDNAADAVVQACQADGRYSGSKYNVTNGEPIELGLFLERLFEQLDIPYNKKNLPYPIAWAVASFLETFHRLFLPDKEPIVTRYSIGVLAKTRTLNIDAAKKDLNYVPKISVEEGLTRYVDWYLKQADQSCR